MMILYLARTIALSSAESQYKSLQEVKAKSVKYAKQVNDGV